MKYQIHQLNNGLCLILAPLEGVETATVLYLVAAGSKYENEKQNGLSHFLEHMFFKGTNKRPNTLAISESLDQVGGIYNAFTGKEYTGYYIKLAGFHLELALEVLSDMLLNSKFDQKEIVKERGVILEEIKLYQDTPSIYVNELFEKLLYGDTPAGREVIGKVETVSRFSRKDLVQYLSRHYSASNSVLIVAGKINLKKTINLANSYFSKISPMKTDPKPLVKENQSKPEILILRKKTDQTHLCLGVRSFGLFDKRRYALALLGAILGGGMSSRLFINIRERKGLCYYIKASQESYTDSGYLVAEAGVAHQNIEKVVKLIIEEFKKIAQGDFNEKEVHKAKEYLKGTLLISLEPPQNVASFLGRQQVLENKIELPEKIFRRLDLLTKKDIKGIAQEIFTDNRLNLALISSRAQSNIIKSLTFK